MFDVRERDGRGGRIGRSIKNSSSGQYTQNPRFGSSCSERKFSMNANKAPALSSGHQQRAGKAKLGFASRKRRMYPTNTPRRLSFLARFTNLVLVDLIYIQRVFHNLAHVMSQEIPTNFVFSMWIFIRNASKVSTVSPANVGWRNPWT